MTKYHELTPKRMAFNHGAVILNLVQDPGWGIIRMDPPAQARPYQGPETKSVLPDEQDSG
jgi:hypothetical protein